MSDHIEVDGRKYFEESYLILANANTKRRKQQRDTLLAAIRQINQIAQRLLAEPQDGDTAPLVEICTIADQFEAPPAEWPAEPDLYYIQNRGFEGNCMRWWKHEGHGYTSNLDEAWKLDRERAIDLCLNRPDEDFAYPCAEIDEIAERHAHIETLRAHRT